MQKGKVEHKEQITRRVNKRLWRNDYFSTCQLEVWLARRMGWTCQDGGCSHVREVGEGDVAFALDIVLPLVLVFVFPFNEQGLVHDGPLKHLFLRGRGDILVVLVFRSQRSGSKGGHSFCFCDHLLVLFLLELLCIEVKLLRTFASFARTALLSVFVVDPLTQGLDLCVGHPQAQGLLLSPPARLGVLGLLGLFFVVEELVAVLLLTLELVLLLDKHGQANLLVNGGWLLLAVVLFELFSLFDQAGFVVVEELDLDGDGAGDGSEGGVY
ncbi:MAG: hypothetical protein BYD32DRAFT_431627 [Podila humilis]|nr:MAG: hypothetical protein BYD32DRAFT_431627 [Podila humilis]